MNFKLVIVTLFALFLLTGILFAGSGDLFVTGNLTAKGNFNLLPAGTMVMYGGSTAPEGWLLCDGSAVSKATYATLFAAIGTTFGAGDGSTTFNVPDFRRRVAVGAGGTGTAVLANTVGSKGGEESHTLTIAEMPAHGGHTGGLGFPSMGNGGGNNSIGGNAAHNNLQPSLIVNYIIKY